MRIGALYLFYTFDFLYRCKWGRVIKQDVGARKGDIQANMSNVFGYAIKIRKAVGMPMFLSEYFEKGLHKVFSFARYKGFPSTVSGYSEWFWFLNPGTATMFIYYGLKWGLFTEHQGLDDHTVWWLAVLFTPYPIDYALLTFACGMIELIVFLAAIGGIGYAIIIFMPIA